METLPQPLSISPLLIDKVTDSKYDMPIFFNNLGRFFLHGGYDDCLRYIYIYIYRVMEKMICSCILFRIKVG